MVQNLPDDHGILNAGDHPGRSTADSASFQLPLPRLAGVTHTRCLLFGAKTPWYRVRLTLGLGTRAASQAIRKLYDHPGMRERMGKAARAYSYQFQDRRYDRKNDRCLSESRVEIRNIRQPALSCA